MLAAGPFATRKIFDFAAEMAEQEGDRDITEVGRDARMPWEINGRHWHTVDRVGRTGNPCRWDGRILAEVVDRIHEKGDAKGVRSLFADKADVAAKVPDTFFAETDWNSRSVVEIRAAKKSEGWFFHAITGEEWLLKMKFRTARNTFKREELVEKLRLKPLNDMPELPLYGTEPRVRCKNLRGPWQEVELRVYGYAEIDRPEFWEFVDRAVAGFGKFTEKRAGESPTSCSPGSNWAASGTSPARAFRWARRSTGTRRCWKTSWSCWPRRPRRDSFLWNNKQVVPVYTPEQHEPWAAVQTKKLDAVYLHLMGPKGRFTLGQITELGYNPELGRRSAEDRHDSVEVPHAGRSGPRRPARFPEGAPGGRAGKTVAPEIERNNVLACSWARSKTQDQTPAHVNSGLTGRSLLQVTNDRFPSSNPISLSFRRAVPISRSAVGRARGAGWTRSTACRTWPNWKTGPPGRRCGGVERSGPGLCGPRAQAKAARPGAGPRGRKIATACKSGSTPATSTTSTVPGDSATDSCFFRAVGKRGQVQFSGTARRRAPRSVGRRTNWTCPLFPGGGRAVADQPRPGAAQSRSAGAVAGPLPSGRTTAISWRRSFRPRP